MDRDKFLAYLDTDNKPEVTEDEIPIILWKVYGLAVTECHQLDSYIDRNYKVKVATKVWENAHITDISTDGYVLKVLNASDSKTPDVPASQLSVMEYLRKFSIVCPQVIQTRKNQPSGIWIKRSDRDKGNSQENNHEVTIDEKAEHYVVILCSFLTGQVLYSVSPYSNQLAYSCGRFAGKMDKALMDFPLPRALCGYQSVWDLRSTLCLQHIIDVIPPGKQRELVTEVQTAFTGVLQIQHTFQRGVIHGDISEHNLLVEVNENSEITAKTYPHYKASAIIDFGDTSVSYYVYELGILICYIMLDSCDENMFEVGGHVMAGYLQDMHLGQEEWGVVRTCVAVRMCQSFVMGAYTYSRHPQNDYVTMTSKRCWDCLERFWAFPEEDLLNLWKSTISSYQRY